MFEGRKMTEITSVDISALPGADIGSCMKEGLELATREWRNVRLKHNGKIYEIIVNDLLHTIKEESQKHA
jgi:hypothetical protein